MTHAVFSLPALAVALLVFGIAPRVLLRVIVTAYRHDDPRRQELLAEFHAVPRFERPFWVAEQIEAAVFEGLYERLHWAATGRVIHRWHLRSGIKLHRAHPDSFWIPSVAEKNRVKPGIHVKLVFEMRDGWGERMWVEVTSIGRRYVVGKLSNTPCGIPRLYPGQLIRFRLDHIVGIDFRSDVERDRALTSMLDE